MTFLNKLKTRLDNIKETAVQHIADLVPTVDDDIKQKRLDICNSCEHLFKPTTQCRKCGCFMNVKTSLADASCPIDKWKVIDISKL